MKSRTPIVLASVAALIALLASNMGQAAPVWEGRDRTLAADRLAAPEDRYAMAGGCYAVRGDDGYVVRAGKGWAATGSSLADAEPFHFQATDLGSYLLFASRSDFLATGEGAVADVVYPAVRSTPGAIADGVAHEQIGPAADAVARSEVNEVSGRGSAIVAAAAPSPLADWVVDAVAPGSFSLILPETDQRLATASDGTLIPAPVDVDDSFSFELTDGCAAYPEIEVNVDGQILGGETDFQEVRGYWEAHLHMMAFEFLGGRARCGRPWHRYGVAYALVDCPDHTPGGQGAVLEQVLSGPGAHNTDGWPTFAGWPRSNSLTHEQIYYKWLERAWRGGLRMFTNLLVDNNQLCKIYPFKRNSCNEMDGVRLQAKRIRELERYIDAQSGGPGEGWFRIVTDPFEARRVINQGKLAVVLGIEVSVPLDCQLLLDMPQCDASQIDERLDEVYDLGVRQMELVNKFDNALSGVTGDGGTTGIVVNQGNKGETGQYWRMETCADSEAEAGTVDKRQMNVSDDGGAPDSVFGRDALVGGILQTFGRAGVAPVYPEGPHCNVLGLSELGEKMIRGMVERGMIFDPDHMSARARTAAVNLIDSLGHSGIVSSHGWADDTIYKRVYELGGVVAPHAGSSTSFVEKWRKHKPWADDRFFFGLGYGADTNGFSTQGGPRGSSAPNKVQYPFQAFGGVTVHQQKSGTKTYDFNREGVAHYGMYPDWVEDVRRLGGADGPAIVEDLARSSEAYLQMWERSIGIAPDACRADVADLTDADVDALENGMSPEQVLGAIGQPAERLPTSFRYCMTGDRSASVTFTPGGSLSGVSIA